MKKIILGVVILCLVLFGCSALTKVLMPNPDLQNQVNNLIQKAVELDGQVKDAYKEAKEKGMTPELMQKIWELQQQGTIAWGDVTNLKKQMEETGTDWTGLIVALLSGLLGYPLLSKPVIKKFAPTKTV